MSDEIIQGLSTSPVAAAAVLHAGVAQADALAPTVFAIAENLCRGAYLVLREFNLLFHGLSALRRSSTSTQHPITRHWRIGGDEVISPLADARSWTRFDRW